MKYILSLLTVLSMLFFTSCGGETEAEAEAEAECCGTVEGECCKDGSHDHDGEANASE